jgi:hypothetical protein
MSWLQNEYSNGYIERQAHGKYRGVLRIDGIDLSPIDGVFFKEEGKTYLWLKRSSILEYDWERSEYRKRNREPRWEAYLNKHSDGAIAFKGEFIFLRFKYQITAIWDKVLKEKNRLNFFVERVPLERQTIINGINMRLKDGREK